MNQKEKKQPIGQVVNGTTSLVAYWQPDVDFEPATLKVWLYAFIDLWNYMGGFVSRQGEETVDVG